ncbi:hypothetical protein M409DRAFT_70077 [Zasmidium cellare ATCC 36951]|uniref:Gfo/Idh/MocA-like oxidoreductase N-terminal domain-containing protein n=1 Tax=Zasmidium cellare ATCC 36951 TaxID=1080233 RepID=A0A6A6C266_ZASCE|nr:uncharacterized protein M409DRAFT_70077 [Zasmidium cellare ATCC 36951]KAF2161003.1 hypothetical protein M409DRAFT_70077 [Zasmidium cellare ATCC 36951]
MADRIGVAIIGSGIIVKDSHLPTILTNPHLTLKALFSRTLASAQSLTKDLPDKIDLYSQDSSPSNTYADLLARSDIRTVIIALPIPVQVDFIKQALTAGKHVLAEKPLAKDVATSVELLEWYRSNIDTSKVLLGIAENWRFTNVFAKAAEEVKRFGKIQAFNARVHFYLPPGEKHTTTEWRKTPEFQGGFLLDSGVHLVAVLRKVLGNGQGQVRRVSAFTTSLAEHLPPVDTVAATLQLENGSAGTVSISFGSTFFDGEWSVACEGGTVSANAFTSELKMKPLGGDEKVSSVPDAQHNVSQEVAAWVKSIQSGEVESRLRPEEALADVEIIEAMLNSGGSPVELKYQI